MSIFTESGTGVTGSNSSNASRTTVSGLSGFKKPDLSSSEALLQLAQMQGGALGAAAEELIHPEKSIIATVGDNFKRSFSKFIDIISVSNQVVAGILSQEKTVGETIRENISASDVIWGEKDPDASTLNKVGSFGVRFATDVLLDPLTYVTFGAGQGIVGLRATSKISLGKKAAEKLGTEELASKALSGEGQEVFKWLKNVERQKRGLDIPQSFGKIIPGQKDEVFDMAKKELDELINSTIDAPLNIDYSKKALTNLLEKYPGLTDDILDKGGIKLFGRSVLSGQRIASAIEMIPGVKLIDQFTEPIRKPLQALFDPALTKDPVTNKYVRMPEEFMSTENVAKDLARALGDDRILNLTNIIKANNLSPEEGKFLMASVEAGRIPIDARLANAYKQMLGFNEAEFEFLKRTGVNISRLDNHAPHILNNLNVKSVGNLLPPKTKAGASLQRTEDLAQPIFKSGEEDLMKFEAAVLSKDQKRIDDTIAEMKNVGMEIFDDNLFTAHFRRTLDNVKVGVSRDFIKEVGDTFGQLKSLANPRWRKIDSGAINDLIDKSFTIVDEDEVVFHPAIAKRIEKFVGAVINDEPTRDMLRAFDSLQNFWKASVTSIFPAFHGRNAISNVFLNLMDMGAHVLNPVIHGQAFQIMKLEHDYRRLSREALELSNDIDPLIQEARKYKSAEEFMKSQGEQVFRGGNNAFDKTLIGEDGVFVSPSKFMAETFGRNVDELYISPNVKVLSYDELPLSIKSIDNWDEYSKAVSKYGREKGVDVIDSLPPKADFPRGMERTVLNPEVVQTKSQLTDIWNKANTGDTINPNTTNKAQEELHDLLNKQIFTDTSGYSWTFGELRRELANRNVAFGRNITGAIDFDDPVKSAYAELFPEDTVLNKAKKLSPFKAGRALGTAIEEQARIVNFVANLKNTGDVSLAAQRTKQFLFDYQALTPFEKQFMRRIMPFYTFTRKNLELQARALLTTPGRVSAEVTALSTLGDVISGEQLTPEEEAVLPDWVRSGSKILKKRREGTIELITGFGTPFEQPFQALQPNQLLGSISPLLRIPLEQASGYSFFQGKALSDVTNAAAFKRAPTFLKDFIGYTEVKGERSDGSDFTWSVALRPERMNLVLNLPPTSRVFSALKQMDAVDVSGQSKILQQLIGLRPFSFDLEQEAQKREKELKTKLENLLTEAGVTAQFKRTYIPKDSKKKGLEGF